MIFCDHPFHLRQEIASDLGIQHGLCRDVFHRNRFIFQQGTVLRYGEKHLILQKRDAFDRTVLYFFRRNDQVVDPFF